MIIRTASVLALPRGHAAITDSLNRLPRGEHFCFFEDTAPGTAASRHATPDHPAARFGVEPGQKCAPMRVTGDRDLPIGPIGPIRAMDPARWRASTDTMIAAGVCPATRLAPAVHDLGFNSDQAPPPRTSQGSRP